MKRLITSKMRDSFNVSFRCRLQSFADAPDGVRWKSICNYFKSTEKQRVLILRRTVK